MPRVASSRGYLSRSNFSSAPHSAGLIILTLTVIAWAVASRFLPILFYAPLAGVVFAYRALLSIPLVDPEIYLIGPALHGALAGLVIGTVHRAFHVRNRIGESLFSSLLDLKLWKQEIPHSLLQVAVNTVVGCLIGLAFASGGAFAAGDVHQAGTRAIARVLAAAGGGQGSGTDLEIFIFVALLIAMILQGAFLVSLLEQVLGFVLFKFAEGASGGAAEQLFITLVEEWGLAREEVKLQEVLEKAIIRGLINGALTGVIVGGTLLAVRSFVG